MARHGTSQRTIDSSEGQFSKAEALKSVTDSGMTMAVNEIQVLKAHLRIAVTDDGMVTDESK